MTRRTLIGIASLVALLAVGAAGAALAAEAARKPDLTGLWRLDARHGDAMQRPGAPGEERGARGIHGGGPEGRGGPGGPGGGSGERSGRGRGGWGGRGGPGGPDHAGGGGPMRPGGPEGGPPADAQRPVRLPDLMHVTQTDQIVSFEDSTGAVLQEITTLGAAKDTLLHAPGAPVLKGRWDGGALVFERPGPRGGKSTQTVTLGDKGDSLVIHSWIEFGGDMPPREFKRIYLRVTEP